METVRSTVVPDRGLNIYIGMCGTKLRSPSYASKLVVSHESHPWSSDRDGHHILHFLSTAAVQKERALLMDRNPRTKHVHVGGRHIKLYSI